MNSRFNNLLETNGWDGARSLAFDFTMNSALPGGKPSSFATLYTGGETIDNKFVSYAQDLNTDKKLSKEERENLNEYAIQAGYLDNAYAPLGTKPGKYKNWILDPAMEEILKIELSKYFGERLSTMSDSEHTKYKNKLQASSDLENAANHGYTFGNDQDGFIGRYRTHLQGLIDFKNELGGLKPDTSKEGMKIDTEAPDYVPTYSATDENVNRLAHYVATKLSSGKKELLTFDAMKNIAIGDDTNNIKTEDDFIKRYGKHVLYEFSSKTGMVSRSYFNLKRFFTDSDQFLIDMATFDMINLNNHAYMKYNPEWSHLKSKTKPGEYINDEMLSLLEKELYYDRKKNSYDNLNQ